MDVVKEDMAEVEVTEEDTVDETTGEGKSAVATPDGKSRKKKKGDLSILWAINLEALGIHHDLVLFYIIC